MLKTKCHLNQCRLISMQTPRTTTAFAQQPLPVALLLHCRRPYCATMVTLRLPHCAHIRTPRDGNCFEHAQSVHHCSAFFVNPQHLLAMPLRCYGDACDCTVHTSAFYIFLGRGGITVRMLLCCDRGFRYKEMKIY